jgi:hypothetical protein
VKKKDEYVVVLEVGTLVLFLKSQTVHNWIKYVWTDNIDYATKFPFITGAQQAIFQYKLNELNPVPKIKKFTTRVALSNV